MPLIDMAVTDLDGTFLDNNGQIPQDNIDACFEATRAGVEMVFATGRPRRNLGLLEPLKELDPLVVASNGANVFKFTSGTVLELFPLDPAIVLTVAKELVEQVPDLLFVVEFVEGWGFESGFEMFEHTKPGPDIVAPVEQLLAFRPALKIVACSCSVNSDDLGNLAVLTAGDRLTCTWSLHSDQGMVEISASGVSKGSSLKDILTQRQIDPRRVAAFGDMPNDITMLDLVGFPFTMATGHSILQQKGYGLAGDNHLGGVGQVLRSLL